MRSDIFLVGDVGGTNARFALANARGQVDAVDIIATTEHRDFADACGTYLERVRAKGMPRPTQAAIAIANPVHGDEIAMTNHHWRISIATTRRQLKFRRLRFINDFTALALSLPLLAPEHLLQIGGGAPRPHAAKALIGPGTGLGVSGLLPAGEEWVPISGEGGHQTLAAGNETEARLIARLRKSWPHVSAERLLCGSGLVLLHGLLAEESGAKPAGELPAAEITRRALEGSDALCAAAVHHFCALLGGIAGDLALTLGALGGVYIGGGIVPRLGQRLAATDFRARFEAKGRFATYLSPIPCYVIQDPLAGLRGAAAALGAHGHLGHEDTEL